MNYILWSVVALLSYALVAPLVSLATNEIPSEVVLVTTNGMLVVAGVLVILVSDTAPTTYLADDAAPYMYAAGAFLAIAILAYYRALEAGPVSVVTPIFGTFLVLSSVVGIVALGESLSVRKGLGIVLAGVAIWLVST
ncbi:EamA family transporter [Halovenus sp. WSH3]|uniref:EamA family transporter n=1 Tax=Halovenus carboxidivorans TaxID=2692199 RepID=A0A6B0SXQ1_9EURY|nr:EamA family transporter [Halovenus carboxidivorans]MXR50125.1 EamA family transporter [Halovenus carboxidivorans]